MISCSVAVSRLPVGSSAKIKSTLDAIARGNQPPAAARRRTASSPDDLLLISRCRISPAAHTPLPSDSSEWHCPFPSSPARCSPARSDQLIRLYCWKHHADLVAAVLVQSDLIQIVAFVIDLPAFLLVQPRDDRQQRRLTAAGWTEDRVKLPLFKLVRTDLSESDACSRRLHRP